MPLKENTKIMPHQKAAEDKALQNDGQILITHGMGLGKTLTSINIADKLMQEGKAHAVLAIVPASLRTNFAENGVKKYTNDKVTVFGSMTERNNHIYDNRIPKTPYYVVSYDMFKKDPEEYLRRTGADTLIVDEMHNFRNPDTVNYQQMKSIRGKVRNFIGLTGTPLNNHPYDTVPLIDIVSNGKHNLGKNKKDFSSKFIRKVPEYDMYGKSTGDDVETIVNKDILKAELDMWNHHATSDDLKKDDVPKKIIQNIDVEMSPLQAEHYKFVMNKVPKSVRDQIRDGMPVSRKEAFHILPMLQQARNVMNGVHYLNKDISLEESARVTPKIKKALDDISQHLRETKDAQVVVHSHMLEGGTDVISAGLTSKGIAHGIFTGREKQVDRDKAVVDYNKGKTKVLVISAAGTTGLNLPNTTMHVALDPHFNPAVIDQIEARGIRAGGQHNRKPEDRAVFVRRYRSVNPPTWYQKLGIGRKDMSVDEWIYGLATNKQDLNNQVDELMKSAASLDAQRGKQYWQLVKRLYGGTENAVKTLSKTHDFNMYHGTRLNSVEGILKDGIKPGPLREFGKGSFLGDKHTAGLYGKTKVVDKYGIRLGNFQGSTTEEALEFIKKPEFSKGYTVSEGAMLRLKRPSELRGTKSMYPKATNSMVFDLDNHALSDIAPRQIDAINPLSKGGASIRRRYKTMVGKKMNSYSDEQIASMASTLPSSSQKDILHSLKSRREGGEKMQSYYNGYLADAFFKAKYIPSGSGSAKAKAQYYGQVRNKRLFNLAGTQTRNEMFVKGDIDASLIKKAQYFYHGTPEKNITSIKKNGLLGSKRGDNFDDPNGSTLSITNAPEGKGVFLTKAKEYAKTYSIDLNAGVANTIKSICKKEPEPLIVNVKKPVKLYAVDNVSDGRALDEYFQPGNIKPKDIIFPDDPEYKKIDAKLSKSAKEEYMEQSTKSKLQDDLKGEYDAIELYQKHINALSNGKIKNKLVEIRDEEKHHTQELDTLIKKEASAFSAVYNSYKSVYNIE